MKVNILRHGEREDYLVLTVEAANDVTSELVVLLKSLTIIEDVEAEQPNAVAFKLHDIEDEDEEKEIKIEIVNMVRQMLSAHSPNPHGNAPYVVTPEQVQQIVAEMTNLRQQNALLIATSMWQRLILAAVSATLVIETAVVVIGLFYKLALN